MMLNGRVQVSAHELMAIELARDLSDGEVGRVGAASHVPLAACFLAQRTHAPSLSVILANGYVNPKPDALFPSSLDERYGKGAEAMLDFLDIYNEAETGGIDFFFYSGIQIDKYGNINLTRVGGDGHRPAFRGPGLPQISFATTLPRFYLFLMQHQKRSLVDLVDYRTAPGHVDGVGGRARIGTATEGPRMCVTPLATFDFADAQMRLRSRSPGVTVSDVQSNTGFDLELGGRTVPETQLPDPELLALLREIDRDGLLRTSVSRATN